MKSLSNTTGYENKLIAEKVGTLSALVGSHLRYIIVKYLGTGDFGLSKVAKPLREISNTSLLPAFLDLISVRKCRGISTYQSVMSQFLKQCVVSMVLLLVACWLCRELAAPLWPVVKNTSRHSPVEEIIRIGENALR